MRTIAWSAPSLLAILGACASPEVQDRQPAAQTLVDRLDIELFRSNIETLAGFGTRYWNTEGNRQALDWIEAQLASFGYEVERHTFEAQRGGDTGEIASIYVTRVGSRFPDRMYIVSAHMDSYNITTADQSFAPGADDDASGTSLVIEMARVFASSDVDTDISIRFALWNAEEIGLQGSGAYVQDRGELQGIEDPPGSGLFPEPTWLGVIQHDMMLFDHGPGFALAPGLPAPDRASQASDADVDIEYGAANTFEGGAVELAAAFLAANGRYAERYPAEVGQYMQSTDSVPFAPYAPSISVRENERRNEIGRNANPNWHQPTDVFETYQDDDFRLGFAALQTSTGAVAQLTGAHIP